MPSDIANSCFQELPCVASLQTLEKNTSAAHNQTYPATGINNHPSLPGGAAAARPLLTAAHGVGAGGAVLAAEQLCARLARLGRLGAAPLPVVELLPVGLLAAPQHRHGAPRLLHHLHDAVQGLREQRVLSHPGFRRGGTSPGR